MQILGGQDTTTIEVVAPDALSVVDLTDRIEHIVADAGIREGMACLFCRHTTCGIFINELEDGLVEDILARMQVLVPADYYAHDDLSRRTQNLQRGPEPANGPAHVRQVLFGASSQMVPIVRGELALGTWQRILFLELDRPRPREVIVSTLGERAV